MNNNILTPEDVKAVAKSLKMELSDDQITKVMELYPSDQDQDPTATWDLVVENCIYQVITIDTIIDENLL